MSSSGFRMKPEALREVAFGAINAAYTQLGAAFTHTIRLITFKNTTDNDVYVSIDAGVTDHFRITSGTQMIIDMKTNDLFLESAQALYIKRAGAVTSGNFIVEAMYY